MTFNATYLVDLGGVQLTEGSDGKASLWLHGLPVGAYKHPVYGTIDITMDRVSRFVESVKNKVRGIDPSVNYSHQGDGEAAGWIKNAEARSDGLWFFVEFTSDATRKLKEKAFKYFSAEFFDEWKDPQGATFKDVVFGGALTNRPFMKNLVPINLSETTVDNAFELVAAISGKDVESLKGGNTSMTKEELDAIVTALAEKLKPADPTPPVTPPSPAKLDLSKVPELKALAEENPLVKALIDQVELQGSSIQQSATKLKETQIEAKLAEFDRSKIVLTPVARELVYKLMKDMPETLNEDFWELLKNMRTSQTFLVELGERAGVTFNYGNRETAEKQFNEMVDTKVKGGMSYADAADAVAAENRDLYTKFRQEAYLNNGGAN